MQIVSVLTFSIVAILFGCAINYNFDSDSCAKICTTCPYPRSLSLCPFFFSRAAWKVYNNAGFYIFVGSVILCVVFVVVAVIYVFSTFIYTRNKINIIYICVWFSCVLVFFCCLAICNTIYFIYKLNNAINYCCFFLFIIWFFLLILYVYALVFS